MTHEEEECIQVGTEASPPVVEDDSSSEEQPRDENFEVEDAEPDRVSNLAV